MYSYIYSLCRELKTILHLGRTTAALTKIPRTFTNFAAREKAPKSAGIRSHGVCEIPTRCVIIHFVSHLPPRKKMDYNASRWNFTDPVRFANSCRLWSLLASVKVRESSWDFRESCCSSTQVKNRLQLPTERGYPYTEESLCRDIPI